jgi:hypothetical protein
MMVLFCRSACGLPTFPVWCCCVSRCGVQLLPGCASKCASSGSNAVCCPPSQPTGSQRARVHMHTFCSGWADSGGSSKSCHNSLVALSAVSAVVNEHFFHSLMWTSVSFLENSLRHATCDMRHTDEKCRETLNIC